jgi:EpsI family protein
MWAGQPATQRTASGPVSAVPTTLGPWVGKATPVGERVIEILETNDVAVVEYRQGEQPPIWLAQVAGFGNRAAFHPPELCYVGSHFEVLERAPVSVMVNGRSVQVMRLVISQNKQRFEAWYWFTANGRVTPNYYQQQLWLLMDTMRGRPMSGTLVRLSTPAEDQQAAHSRLLTFMSFFDASTRGS